MSESPQKELKQEKHSGLPHLFHAMRWSWAGMRAAFRDEAAFRQELLLFAILAPLAFWLGQGAIEIALLLGSLFLILMTELLNTAIEAAVDRIGGEDHALSRKAKDVGSAAVMLAIVNAAVVWGLIGYWRAAP